MESKSGAAKHSERNVELNLRKRSDNNAFFENKRKVAEVKHNYLDSWLPILCNNPLRNLSPKPQYTKLVYIDGFAGPGKYKNKELGSPLVAYKLALEHHRIKKDGPEMIMIFIEKLAATCQDLLYNLQKYKYKNRHARNGKLISPYEFVGGSKF